MENLDAFNGDPMAELERVVGGAAEGLRDELDDLRARLSEYICPHCGAALSGRNEAPIDDEQRHWDLVESYECGFQTFAGDVIHPCPSDPRFPTLDDYDVVCERQDRGTGWVCCALPKTDMARKVRLQECHGKSEEVAGKLMKAMYYRAGRITNAEWWRLQADIARAG